VGAITTVLLDAGGVILDETDHEKVRVEIAVEVLRTVVPDMDAEHLYSDLDEAIHVFCPRILAYVLWKHLKPDRVAFDRLHDSFRSRWRERRPPLTLMMGLEEELKTISASFDVGIAGQYGRDLLGLLDQSGLLRYFKYRFTQDDFAITKPDPRYLAEIAERCGVDPCECIMVGDRIDNDVIPARHLGMRTVLVRVGLHRNQQPRTPFEMPDEELQSIRGLSQTILNITRRL
jgi:FMN phosphatase YigB (HAD superfamily)